MAESDEKDLVITALRQRIGELVSSYETDMAIIRASYTKLKEEYDHIVKILKDQTETSTKKVEVSEKEKEILDVELGRKKVKV